ncbi:MAG: NnrS family protein [Proteobacteria bacterium]|nr:NnrS family protein [Pseudomonadota bacterium]
MASSLQNPYKPFFFVGTMSSMIGVLLWITYATIDGHPYPGRLHAHLMMGVFLMSFALGFLMTALPKLTQSFYTTQYEFIFSSLILGWLTTVAMLDSTEESFFIGIILLVLFLIYFASRRLKLGNFQFPNFFPLLFWGLFSALGGSLLFFTEKYRSAGEALFYQNFMLCLVLGIGTFLVPKVLAISTPSKIYSKLSYTVIGFILTASLFLYEVTGHTIYSYVRAALTTFIILFSWKIFTKAESKTSLKLGIRVALTGIMIGLWVLAVLPQYRLEGLHSIYVLGFSLLSYLVASRVIIAHGNHGLALELNNKYIRTLVFFLVLAGLTRIAAAFIPNGYEKHLAYASASFTIGVLVWSKFFIPKTFTTYS